MTTRYLAWLVTQDHIRFKYWPMAKESLRILRDRFSNLDDLLAEMRVDTPPPDRLPTPEQLKKRKVEKAEKLRQLEARRAKERKKRQGERCQAQQLDAGYYVHATWGEKRVDPNDISDLL